MKTLFILFLTYGLYCSFPSTCWSQDVANRYPEVGRSIPDFSLNDVHYYATTKVSKDDFKGKWLVLYFWNRYCSICMEKMPMLDSLQQELSDQNQILLIGYTGSQYTKQPDEQRIKELYELKRIDYNLNLPVAYDSTLFHRFNLGPSPYIIIISPKSEVKAITTTFTPEELRRVFSGMQFSLKRAYRRDELNRN